MELGQAGTPEGSLREPRPRLPGWPRCLGQGRGGGALLSLWPEGGVAQVGTWVSHLEPASKDKQLTRVRVEKQETQRSPFLFSRPASRSVPALVGARTCPLATHGFWSD